MRTLDLWESRLSTVPSTIDCPHMQLLGRDHEPPIFVGPGHIDIRTLTAIDFTMYASSVNDMDALKRLGLARQNPYEITDQFRLIATDYQGTEWACGWTCPDFKQIPKTGWPLTGKLKSLVAQVSGPLVAPDSGIELIFQPKLDLPMDKAMTSVTSVDSEVIERRRSGGEQTLHVLDSEIKFFYKPFDKSLWVSANTSEKLKHPFLENMIAEPLRILLGQLVFPRVVARNLGNGTAQVWLRPSPRRFSDSGLAALFQESPFAAPTKFWDLYSSLLKLITEAKNAQVHPDLEAHQITRFYEEIAQATQGSRWVLCMTLASTGEGLANMLVGPTARKFDFPEADIRELKKFVKSWPVNKDLRDRALELCPFLGERGTNKCMRDLAERGMLLRSNVKAWLDVRNQVMHGRLVSPWATKEEDERIIALADLVHRLTGALISQQGKTGDNSS